MIGPLLDLLEEMMIGRHCSLDNLEKKGQRILLSRITRGGMTTYLDDVVVYGFFRDPFVCQTLDIRLEIVVS
jgi:hypothetical protein